MQQTFLKWSKHVRALWLWRYFILSTINILMLRLISIPRKDGQVKWKWFTDLGNSCPGNRFRLRMNYVDGAESPDAWNSCVNRTRWSRYPYGCNDVLGSTTYPLRVANVFDRMSSVWCAHPRWTCCSRWNQPIALKKTNKLQTGRNSRERKWRSVPRNIRGWWKIFLRSKTTKHDDDHREMVRWNNEMNKLQLINKLFFLL